MKNDYLRYEAESMRSHILSQLSKDGKFTDQLFRGSNLSVLTEIFSFMYDALTYQLNTEASEAMFTETEFYANMNRLVKGLGYNPGGVVTSHVPVNISIGKNVDGLSIVDGTGLETIPKYLTYTTENVSSTGTPIRYSTVARHLLKRKNSLVVNNESVVMYNGTWNLYPVSIISDGIPYETILLDVDLSPTNEDRVVISHGHIDVYEKTVGGDFILWSPTNDLYEATAAARVFEYRLNEDMRYELKFGDDIRGKRLSSGSELLIVYLKSDGSDGIVHPREINIDSSVLPSVMIEGMGDSDLNGILTSQYATFRNVLSIDQNFPILPHIRLENSEVSSELREFESVEEIRERAPRYYRQGGRLVTQPDFESFILSTYMSTIYDVTVMNNWEYMSTFLRWVDSYGKLDSNLRNWNYMFSDSCDFNNIYIFCKSYLQSRVPSLTKRRVEMELNDKKPLTAEICFADPINTWFTPYVKGYNPNDITDSYSLQSWDPERENQIEIVRHKSSILSKERIQESVVGEVLDFFSLSNNKLGQSLDFSKLYNSILNIEGVASVRTRYRRYATDGSVSDVVYVDGLSFATWSTDIIAGADFNRVSGNHKVEDFQFPTLVSPDNISGIIDVRTDAYNIGGVEY